MAHNVMIDGTAYTIKGGRTMVDGTAYAISKGRTLVDGTGYDVNFKVDMDDLLRSVYCRVSTQVASGITFENSDITIADCLFYAFNGGSWLIGNDTRPANWAIARFAESVAGDAVNLVVGDESTIKVTSSDGVIVKRSPNSSNGVLASLLFNGYSDNDVIKAFSEYEMISIAGRASSSSNGVIKADIGLLSDGDYVFPCLPYKNYFAIGKVHFNGDTPEIETIYAKTEDTSYPCYLLIDTYNKTIQLRLYEEVSFKYGSINILRRKVV